MHTYVIPRGKHRSMGYRFLFKRPRYITFKIDKSFINSNNLSPDQGWSKLFGYSDSLIHHHRNSIRIGIRLIDGVIWTCAYYYNNGKRGWELIKPIEPSQRYFASIQWTKGEYIVSVDGTTVSVPRTGRLITYPLFPYIGGKLPSSERTFIFMDYFGDGDVLPFWVDLGKVPPNS
jgi:hypothetical protein